MDKPLLSRPDCPRVPVSAQQAIDRIFEELTTFADAINHLDQRLEKLKTRASNEDDAARLRITEGATHARP